MESGKVSYRFYIQPNIGIIILLGASLIILTGILFLFRWLYISGTRKEHGEGYFDIFKVGLHPIGKKSYIIASVVVLIIISLNIFWLIGNMFNYIIVSENGYVELVNIDVLIFNKKVYKSNIIKVELIEDIKRAGELTPRLRLYGNALGYYYDGWFLMKNGHRALYMVNNKRAIALLLDNGLYIILGPKDFGSFINYFNTYIYYINEK